MPATSRPSASRWLTARLSLPFACSTGIRALRVPAARFFKTGSASRVITLTQYARSACAAGACPIAGRPPTTGATLTAPAAVRNSRRFMVGLFATCRESALGFRL